MTENGVVKIARNEEEDQQEDQERGLLTKELRIGGPGNLATNKKE
jgi:hypothetical protein